MTDEPQSTPAGTDAAAVVPPGAPVPADEATIAIRATSADETATTKIKPAAPAPAAPTDAGPTDDTGTIQVKTTGGGNVTTRRTSAAAKTTPAAVPATAWADASGRAVGVATVTRSPIAVHRTSDVVRIGRAAGNDIVLPDLRASNFHAEVRRVGDGYQIVDMGSTNGVHLNGARVGTATLAEGDRVSVGRHDFVFDGAQLHEFVDTGPSSLFADDLTVQVGKATLLDDVSFAVQQGSLVGVIGPSGCGKSTLIKAVTGLRPADQGKVHYDGRSLYDEYQELKYRIGMVPQDDVLHKQLTVRRALRFAASLRFADDVSRKDRHARVDEVIHLLGLEQRAKQRIDTLSGGQRKRTSVALELLTEPSLLALDEPTSGLDPALDREVMRELRRLADNGRTVLVVTHSVLHLAMCDRVLVMCLGGRMGYFGPPEEVLDFFGAKDYADVFEMITNDATGWSVRYRNSETYRKHVGEVVLQLTATPALQVPAPRSGERGADAPVVPAGAPVRTGETTETDAAVPPVAAPPTAASPAPIAATGPDADREVKKKRALAAPFRQWITLSARMISVIASDKGYAAFLFFLPFVLALLSHAVPGNKGLGPDTTFSLQAQRILVVLVVGASFMGIATAIREIVGEAPIYARERAVGISPGAYLGSKLLVFLIIDIIQVTIFVNLALIGLPKERDPLIFTTHPVIEVIVPVVFVAFISTILGLLCSTLVKTSEQTTPILVVAVMTELVLSGGLFILSDAGVLNQISWVSPTRWGFAATASSVDVLNTLPPFNNARDPLWQHTTTAWWHDMLWLAVQAVVLVVLARLALKRKDPGKKG